MNVNDVLPLGGLVRAKILFGDKINGVAPVLPFSRSAFFAGIAAGTYPAPVRLGARAVAWKCDDIRKLLDGTWPLPPARTGRGGCGVSLADRAKLAAKARAA